MLVEFNTDIIVVKHEVEDFKSYDPYHTFAVWFIPEPMPEQKALLTTFEGDFTEARSECRSFLDAQYHHLPVLWIKQEAEVYAHCEE